jgi:hypothetical protein
LHGPTEGGTNTAVSSCFYNSKYIFLRQTCQEAFAKRAISVFTGSKCTLVIRCSIFNLQWQGIWVIKPFLQNYRKKISVGDYERKSRKVLVKGIGNGGSKDIYRG